MAEMERVPVGELRDLIVVGEPLPFRVLDGAARLLLNEGQVVGSQRQFEMLIERMAWVERALVETARQARVGATGATAPAAQHGTTLFDLWEKTVWDLDELTRRLVRGEARAAEVEGFAVRLLALMDRDIDVALFLCARQDDKRFALYALTHGLHCAVLGSLVARQLGWTSERLLCLAQAALTMNLAIHELQAVLAEQREPPGKRQLEQLRAHPDASAELLRKAGVVDADWLAAVQDHHERADGGGYPRGTQEVSDMAALLRATDVFMAKISPRAARAPMVPQLATRQLFQSEGGAAVATALIRAVGLYPPGSLVQLRSGEVAVVTRRPSNGSAPLVATLSNRQGVPVVDTQRRDTAEPEFAVQSPLADASAFGRVLPERVYGLIYA